MSDTTRAGGGDTPLRQTIGPYRLLDALGEGGMGIVYLAEQDAPIRRRVAIKLIKLGMDTREVVARFEAERQALALMDHPNIARVFDAGATPDGRPYFAMEYVPGIPLTGYCDRHRLSTDDRLRLFLDVCGAVQHAHQKGVIHRDLKPSNVLVAVQDGRVVPKIIDFGVAKATSQRLTERTVFTQHGLIIGTPEYMSPEQADQGGVEVDSTTDIYSLGVVLYELLVGTLPFESATLRKAAYGEILRIIREEEPPRPSTRLSGLGDGATAIAERRRTDRRTLAGKLRGELDWVALKAMEKDRTRRYASASELAADITRHLRNEPVGARPPSFSYRAQKFARRNRVAVAAAGAIAAALVAGLVVSLTLYFRAEAARALADSEAAASYAWARDMSAGDRALTQYLPLARQALSQHRRATAGDPLLLVNHLMLHLMLTSTGGTLPFRRETPASVEAFEQELSQELENVVLAALERGDPRALPYLFIVDEKPTSRREHLARSALRVAEQHPLGNEQTLSLLRRRLGSYLWARGTRTLEHGDASSAVLALREAVLLYRASERDWIVEVDLARALMALKRYAEAEPLLLECHTFFQTADSGYRNTFSNVRSLLVALYEESGRPDRALEFRGAAAVVPATAIRR